MTMKLVDDICDVLQLDGWQGTADVANLATAQATPIATKDAIAASFAVRILPTTLLPKDQGMGVDELANITGDRMKKRAVKAGQITATAEDIKP